MITVGLLPGDDHASGASPTASAPSSFARAVLRVVDGTRPGEVLTYAEVAAEAGSPGAARGVGRVLRVHGSGEPWWRVVAANGRLVPGLEAEHEARLVAEGITVSGGRARRPPEHRTRELDACTASPPGNVR